MEIAKELDSVLNELTVPVDIRRKGENEHVKIIEWKNDKHVAVVKNVVFIQLLFMSNM